MKKILFLAMFLMLTASVLADYTIDWTITGNVDFHSRVYRCTNTSGACTESTISLVDQDKGMVNELEVTGVDRQYFIFYNYPSDNCEVPYDPFYKVYSGSGYATRTLDLTFVKQDAAHCGSNVENAQLTEMEIPLGASVSMSADLQSAWSAGGDISNFIPSELDKYFSSHVDVYFSVDDAVLEHDVYDINWNEWKHVSYDFTPTAVGTYVLKIATKMDNDCRCDGSNYKYRELVVNVVDEPNEIPEFGIIGVAGIILLAGLFIIRKR